MGSLAIYSSMEHLCEAVEAFLRFAGLSITVRQIPDLESLHEIEDLEALILDFAGNNAQALGAVRNLRESVQDVSLPILLMLDNLNGYLKTICNDLEYVLPCPYPPNSGDLILNIRKLIFFSRKKRRMLEHRSRIQALFKSFRFSDALKPIDQYLDEGSDKFRVNLLKTRAYLGMRDFKAAAQAALAAVNENKHSLEARSLLCNVYLEVGQHDKAKEVLLKSLNLAPEHPKFLEIRARLHFIGMELTDAEDYFEASINHDPTQAEAFAGLVAVKLLQGRGKDAPNIIRRSPKPVARQLQMLAVHLAQAKAWSQAEKLLRLSFKLIPQQKDPHIPWMNIGFLARKAGVNNWAKTFYEAAAAVSPAGNDKAAQILQEMDRAS